MIIGIIALIAHGQVGKMEEEFWIPGHLGKIFHP